MIHSYVAESRPLDTYYDPVYASHAVDNSKLQGPSPAVPSDGGNPVAGPHAFKYRERPRIPTLANVAPEILLALSSGNNPLEVPEDDEPEPFQKDAETQTMYRESEAQTDPYTPAYVLNPQRPQPEVLMLQELSYGQGLPVGLREVEMLEHARAKRELENSLPPFTDEASLALRKRLMETQEVRELKLREKELDAARDARLEVLQKALEERDANHEFIAQQRVEALRQIKVMESRQLHSKTQARRIKVLRKIAKSRDAVRMPGDVHTDSSRDIVKEYANFASSVYAPLQRDGRLTRHADSLARTAPAAAAITSGSSSIENMVALESSLKTSITQSVVHQLKKARHTKGATSMGRKATIARGHLEAMAALLATRKAAAAAEARALSAPDKSKANMRAGIASRDNAARTAGERPPTPSVPELADESLHRAVQLLQRLLRGRAAQNKMYEGKERCIELIRELRNAQRVEDDDDAREAMRAAMEHRNITRVREAALDAMAGSITTAMLQEKTGDMPDIAGKSQDEDITTTTLTEGTIQNLVTSFLAPTVERLSISGVAGTVVAAEVLDTEEKEHDVLDNQAG